MKKIVFGLLFIIATFLLFQCEKEKMIPGEVGIPVYLVPDVVTSSDTSGCTFNWSFTEKPVSSALNILSFQPSSNGYNIYFIPDVSGNFHVKCEVLTSNRKLKQESVFVCRIKPNASGTKKPVVSGTVSEKPKELDPVYLEDKQTSEPEKVTKTETKVEPEPETQKTIADIPKQPAPKTDEKGLYTIQISSFKTYANAERELNELKKMGMQDIFIKKTYIKSKDAVWYRIRTNSYSTITEARSVLKKIKTKYKRKSAWIDKID